MTIARIEHVAGTKDSEYITVMCTGCNEYFSYSVRQYKGDFGCNISEFESFLQWAKWEAARHECFLAGRMGYIEEPPEDPLAYHVDFPQVETREEDPWGGVGYVVEPDEEACYAHEECDMEPCTHPDEEDLDDLDSWLDEELDLPLTDYRYGALSADEAQAILLGYVYDDDSDNYDWEENRFDFLYGEPTMLKTYGIFEIREMPRKFEGEMVYIEFDYAEVEQRVMDEELLKAGVYSLDNQGCLRDECGRCLACLRPGPHFPFYYDKDKR